MITSIVSVICYLMAPQLLNPESIRNPLPEVEPKGRIASSSKKEASKPSAISTLAS
jgi:hypothetical protein